MRLFITTFNKSVPKLWQEHRGESRWSPFHRIPCGNFRGLFPNPFKWTFHLSASSSVSAIPTVEPFLHHFLHNLAWSQGQNKCLWEIWSAYNMSKELNSWPREGGILGIQLYYVKDLDLLHIMCVMYICVSFVEDCWENIQTFNFRPYTPCL